MKKQVLAYLHTHWDREWYRNKEEFNIRFLDVFDIVLDELKHNKAPFFYMDGQVIALLDYLKYRKDKKETIIKLIEEKKLAIGPYFVSADSYLTSFCCMLKNLDIGINFSKEFHQKDFIGYMADIFGISNSAFEALNLKNIDKAVIWRGVNPASINNNCNFIKDNIKTTWLVQGYFNDFIHNKNTEGLAKYLDKISEYSDCPLLLPIGADHLGMLKNASGVIDEINQKLDKYVIKLTNPFEYFKKASFKNICKVNEFLDNEKTYILPGVYSARIHQKILNNKAQILLNRIVEPLNYFLNEKYEPNIDFAYQTILKNHAHDGIYGCSTDEVHKATESRFLKCINISNAILNNIVSDFKKNNNICGKTNDKIGIFNLSNSKNNIFTVKTPYKVKNSQILFKESLFPNNILYDIYKIPVTEEITTIYTSLIQTDPVDSFTYKVSKILKPKKNTKITLNTLENDNIKLFIKNNKVYIQNKKNSETVEFKLTDIKDKGDSYNFAPIGEYKILDIKNTKIIEDGIIQSSLMLKYKDIELIAGLNNSSEYIKFKAKIKNKTKNHKLQAVFVTKNNINKTISDEAIGLTERKIDCNYILKENMPVKYPHEAKTNSFPLQNFVTANNFTVLTKGLHEYEVYKNEIKICLLRCTGTISNPKNPARAIPAGPNLKCTDSQYINKTVEAEFGVLFKNHIGVYKNIDLFNEIYTVIDGDIKEEKQINLLSKEGDSYIYGINSGKKIEYNISKRKVSVSRI